MTDRTTPRDHAELPRNASRRRFLTRAGIGGVGVAAAGSGLPAKLGRDQLGALAGDRSYTRAHFLYHAGVVQPGVYR